MITVKTKIDSNVQTVSWKGEKNDIVIWIDLNNKNVSVDDGDKQIILAKVKGEGEGHE